MNYSNISVEKVQHLAQQSGQLKEDIQATISWVERYLKDEEREEVSLRLKKLRRYLLKVRYALLQKPAAALYGESQVGKSYLIKNLLSLPGEEFKVTDPGSGKTYDFLESINPKGDQTEATSVVTRFTIDPLFKDPRFPVTMQLLSPKDLVLFLCDSYFSDISDHRYNPRKEEIESRIGALANEFGSKPEAQQALTEDDLYDIQEYLEQFFNRATYLFKDARFWQTAAAFIGNVPPNQWYRVFQIIWGELRPFNDIFNRMVAELERLGFSETVYVAFDAVLRDYGTILHVARLRELQQGPVYEDVSEKNYRPEVDVQLLRPSGALETKVNKSMLCALCKELILQVDKGLASHMPFLNHSDLLDFPGARSRLENRESSITDEHVDLMVLRGKVSYIFNKYSGDRLISNLLFCNKDAKIEVKYIPALLDKWISDFIGRDAGERTESLRSTSIPPIFIIFTFFNNDLRFNEKNDTPEKLDEKWIKRFRTIFANEIVTNNFNWHTQWTTPKPAFQNFYLLRDFTHSRELYTGYAKEGKETGFADIHFKDKFTDATDYYNQLRKSFLENEFVRDHFKSPEESWEEAATPNKDGSDLIIRNLTQVSNNYLRTRRFVNLINEYLREFRQILDQHYHSDRADEQIRTAARTGAEIQAYMNAVFSKSPYHFGRFIKAFTIAESHVYNFFRERLRSIDLINVTNINQYIYFRLSSPGLSNLKTYEENVEVLRKDYHLNDAEEVERFFADKQVDLQELFFGELNSLKNNSLSLAAELRDSWFINYLRRERFHSFIEEGFSAAAIDKLLDNMKVSFDRQQMVQRIASEIKQYVDRYDKVSQAEEMMADISAAMINRFVNSFGWDYYTFNEIQKVKTANQANELNLDLPGQELPFDPIPEPALNQLFEDVNKLNESLSKLPPDEDAIRNVPLIRQYRRWRDLMKVSFIATCHIPSYDPEGNRKLSLLRDKVNSFTFALD